MSCSGSPQVTDYSFGPFRLSLSPGWTGNFEDGVHTISSDSYEAAVQISGFERDAPTAMSDLYGMVPEGADDVGRFTLAAGLDGFSWHEAERDVDMRIVRAGSAVLAISIIGSDEGCADIVDEMLGSLALSKEASA